MKRASELLKEIKISLNPLDYKFTGKNNSKIFRKAWAIDLKSNLKGSGTLSDSDFFSMEILIKEDHKSCFIIKDEERRLLWVQDKIIKNRKQVSFKFLFKYVLKYFFHMKYDRNWLKVTQLKKEMQFQSFNNHNIEKAISNMKIRKGVYYHLAVLEIDIQKIFFGKSRMRSKSRYQYRKDLKINQETKNKFASDNNQILQPKKISWAIVKSQEKELNQEFIFMIWLKEIFPLVYHSIANYFFRDLYEYIRKGEFNSNHKSFEECINFIVKKEKEEEDVLSQFHSDSNLSISMSEDEISRSLKPKYYNKLNYCNENNNDNKYVERNEKSSQYKIRKLKSNSQNKKRENFYEIEKYGSASSINSCADNHLRNSTESQSQKENDSQISVSSSENEKNLIKEIGKNLKLNDIRKEYQNKDIQNKNQKRETHKKINISQNSTMLSSDQSKMDFSILEYREKSKNSQKNDVFEKIKQRNETKRINKIDETLNDSMQNENQ